MKRKDRLVRVGKGILPFHYSGGELYNYRNYINYYIPGIFHLKSSYNPVVYYYNPCQIKEREE